MAIDSVRGRLTLFWVAALAAALVTVAGLIYVLMARALYNRIDENLGAVVQIAATSLANDLAEGQDYEDAARATYRDGMLRIELPLVRPESRTRSVPIEVDRDEDLLEG